MNADILFFFTGHIDALPLYQRLETLILEQIPDIKIKVSKTQVSFSNKRSYPGRWTHHVMVGSEEEIDKELMGLICEAAEVSTNKKR